MFDQQLRNCFAVILLACVIASGAPAQDTVREPARDVPVIEDADVVVIGGGLSGVGAALGAARNGAKTLVIERTGYLGGWLRGTGLGNHLAHRDRAPGLNDGVLLDITKRMVDLQSEGNTELKTVLERGDIVVSNPEHLPYAFQSLAIESGVKILYFSNYSTSIVHDGHIDCVIIETPSGRAAVRGKVFIDCTGLATVAAESGAPTTKQEASMGLAGLISGVDRGRFKEYEDKLSKEPDPQARKWLEAKLGFPITTYKSDHPELSGMNWPWDDWLDRTANVLGKKFRDAVDRGEMPLFYKVGEKGIVSFWEGLKVEHYDITGDIARPRTWISGVDPTNIEQLSEAHIKSVQYLFKLTEFCNKNIPGFEKAQLTRMADTTMGRAGRHIEPEAPFSTEIKPTKNDDAILVFALDDKHGPYEMPYRALLPAKIDNLLVVGKSSAGGETFRKHHLTIIMGQAAGIAAALAVHDGVPVKLVEIRKLQAELRKGGIPIPQK